MDIKFFDSETGLLLNGYLSQNENRISTYCVSLGVETWGDIIQERIVEGLILLEPCVLRVGAEIRGAVLSESFPEVSLLTRLKDLQ